MILPPDSIRRVRGFGGADWSDGYVFRPTSIEQVLEVFQNARLTGRSVCIRGAGKSYGDAAMDPEQVILDTSDFSQILDFDPATGLANCEPGVTIEQLWKHCIASGWWPPVVTGTQKISLGGALAMNVHGKNQFRVGSFGEYVREVDVIRADGSLVTIGTGDPEMQWIAGGMSMFGVITRIRLQMHRVESGNLNVHATRATDWEDAFAQFAEFAPHADYLVGWIDMFAKGAKAGRGVIHHAHYDSIADGLFVEAQALPTGPLKKLAPKLGKMVTNRAGMRIVNLAKYMFAGSKEKDFKESLTKFSFLLDAIPDWITAYGRDGLVQVQVFIPYESALAALKEITEIQQSWGQESFLAVLKKHRPDPFPLSWALDGFSLAMDFKATDLPSLREMAREINRVTLDAGGRFYFAKDSLLEPEEVQEFLGRDLIAELRRHKLEHDPEGLFQTQLMRRVGLI